MTLIFRTLLIFSLFISTLYAKGEVLSVGVESFQPPFAIQGSNDQIYGFDVEMMTSLCKIIERTCKFKVMRFEQLIPAVIEKQVDVAVSAITITKPRMELVDFSLPYLLSHSRFLTKRANATNQPFNISILNNKKIGVELGTVFAQQVVDMGVKNAVITEYPTTAKALEALSKGTVDFILLDNPNAIYWATNSSNEFVPIGQPYLYGFGFGIVVNKNDRDLLQSINKALLQYQSSEDYKLNYNRYIFQF